jgi:hypothetical protein
LGKSTNNPRHGGPNDAGDQAGYEEEGLSMKHPREEDYEVEVQKGDNVVVIFKPTGRHYDFSFLIDGSLNAPKVVKQGDVGDYLMSEVDALARRLASAAVRTSP